MDAIVEEIRNALKNSGIDQLTELQRKAYSRILSGENLLIIAPTGSGKTEAAMIPLFQKILMCRERRGISLIYITPLRALNRDMLRRLRSIAENLGISIDLRHGDTPESRRMKQSRSPPEILITTPETFQILFLGKKLREALKNVRYVVIDEIHELVDNERGAQLSIALERLREIAQFQLIALSATVSEPSKVAAFVKCTEVLDESAEKEYSFKVVKPEGEYADIQKNLQISKELAAELGYIRDIIAKHGSVLVFVNTRATAEALGLRLKKLLDIEVHHGSLSKEARVEAEEKFASGQLKALICTSSMELGIDIGHVNAVIQYSSPRQVIRLIQRVGRSGHRLGERSRGYIIACYFDDILESWAIVRRAENGLLEGAEIHFKSLDVLANQIAAMALEYGRIDAKKVYGIIRRSYLFRNLSVEEFNSICQYLAEIGRIFYDGKEIVARRGTRKYFYDNISMIPDEKRYRVVDVTTKRTIGTLDESFLSTFSGEIFAMKGELWRVLSVDEAVRVEPVTAEGEIPSWAGEEIPVPFEVAQDVGRLRMWIAGLIRTYGKEKSIEILMKEFDTNEEACREVVRVISEQIQKGFAVPTDTHLTIESSEGICVINACFGHKVNEALGRILALLLSAKKGRNVSVEIDPYRIRLYPASADEVKEVLLSVKPETVEFLAERALTGTRLLEWKVVNSARKFGLLSKSDDLSRVNLKNFVVKLKETPVYREALREIFLEKMDVKKAAYVFEKIEKEITLSIYHEFSPISTASLERSFDLISAKPDETVLKAFRDRIKNELCRIYCLNCEASYVEKVASLEKFVCIKCGSRMIAVFSNRRRVEDFRREELFRMANLILSYGKRAVYALNAYGVGTETAARILSRYYQSEEEFFRTLLDAERNYVKTRRFWDL
jgi:ATP-dependent Lhr-like helicase